MSMNHTNKNKIINCSRCGTNPWKQGCYALWGKSPKDLLFDKENDTGYICSVCAVEVAKRGRTLCEELDPSTPPNDFMEKYKQCPIYGEKSNKKYE